MAFHLVVKHNFGSYQIGQRIEDQDAVSEILAGENEHFVLRVLAPDVERPAALPVVAVEHAFEPIHHDE